MRQKLIVLQDTRTLSGIIADEEYPIFIQCRIRQRKFRP